MASSTPNNDQVQQYQQINNEPERVFTLFPNLPVELQMIIFELALPGPRVIDFLMTGFRGEWWKREISVRPRQNVPSLLQVCQLSRRVSLSSYSLLHWEGGYMPWGYINFDIDTLSLTRRSKNDPTSPAMPFVLYNLSEDVLEEDRNKVKHMLAPRYPFDNRPSLATELLPKFPNLESLTFHLNRTVLHMNEDYSLRSERASEYVNPDGTFRAAGLLWIPIELAKMKAENPTWKEPKIEYLLEPDFD